MFHRDREGKSLFPIRYLAILVVAVGIAESVHAPSIQRSNASSPKTDPDTPASKGSASPAEKDSKKPGTTTVNPAASSDDQNPSFKDLESLIEPFMPSPSQATPAQADLLAAPTNDPPSFSSGSSATSVGAAAPRSSVTAGPNQDPIEGDGFSGSATPGGVVNDGPVNRGLVHNALTVSGVTSVPEPGSVLIIAIGAMGLLQRRRR